MMYWKCACGMTNEETTLACVGCGWTKPIEYPKAESTRVGGLLDPNNRHVVGLIGSLLLFIGVFCPIVSAPIIGNINYFQNGKGDGVLIIILAGISLALTFSKQYSKLLYTGLISIGILAFTFINFQIKMAEMKKDMEVNLVGNPFRGIADMAMQSVQLQWGWAILIIGAAFLIAAARLNNNKVLSTQ